LAATIKENAGIILTTLYTESKKPTQLEIDGERIQNLTKLEPDQINDAVAILRDNGYVEWQQFMGTAPFEFSYVEITPRGKAEYERALEQSKNAHTVSAINPAPTPVGSPYGFQDTDWELVAERKAKRSKIFVVVGYQFASSHYKSEVLINNLQNHFEKAVKSYNALPASFPVELDFKSLAAGYGEHLFNEICRDIICADIAVFETSDVNPNVMLEMGVALTWDVRVLPIKMSSCPKPPSDISGQTWADYEDNACRFIDQDHDHKMLRMIERAARKKRAQSSHHRETNKEGKSTPIIDSDSLVVSNLQHPDLRERDHRMCVLGCTIVNKSGQTAAITKVIALDQKNNPIQITWSNRISALGNPINPHGLIGIKDTETLFVRENTGKELDFCKLEIYHSFSDKPLSVIFDEYAEYAGWDL